MHEIGTDVQLSFGAFLRLFHLPKPLIVIVALLYRPSASSIAQRLNRGENTALMVMYAYIDVAKGVSSIHMPSIRLDVHE